MTCSKCGAMAARCYTEAIMLMQDIEPPLATPLRSVADRGAWVWRRWR